MISRDLSLLAIENTIRRLELPLRDSISFAISGRELARDLAINRIEDLYDLSLIDSCEKERLLDLLDHAYIHGGL